MRPFDYNGFLVRLMFIGLPVAFAFLSMWLEPTCSLVAFRDASIGHPSFRVIDTFVGAFSVGLVMGEICSIRE